MAPRPSVSSQPTPWPRARWPLRALTRCSPRRRRGSQTSHRPQGRAASRRRRRVGAPSRRRRRGRRAAFPAPLGSCRHRAWGADSRGRPGVFRRRRVVRRLRGARGLPGWAGLRQGSRAGQAGAECRALLQGESPRLSNPRRASVAPPPTRRRACLSPACPPRRALTRPSRPMAASRRVGAASQALQDSHRACLQGSCRPPPRVRPTAQQPSSAAPRSALCRHAARA
jgi:hypothetical protein